MTQTADVRIEEQAIVTNPPSWRAILAGLVVAIVTQLLLAILGSAIGLAFINPATSGNPSGTTAGIVAAIWWTLSGILIPPSRRARATLFPFARTRPRSAL